MSDTSTEAAPPASAHARFTFTADAEEILGYTRRELANVVRATAQELTEHGWCQGTTRDLDGKLCLVGALHRVTYQSHIYGAALSCLWDQLVLSDHSPELSPIGWNDAPGRTAEQVVALCNATADRLEAS